jgi:hypothetical protein
LQLAGGPPGGGCPVHSGGGAPDSGAPEVQRRPQERSARPRAHPPPPHCASLEVSCDLREGPDWAHTRPGICARRKGTEAAAGKAASG